MRKIVILATFIYSLAIADEWFTISPLETCEELTIQYQVADSGQYKIRYKENYNSDVFINFSKNIDDINNLIELTDVLNNIESNYCPFKNLELSSTANISCQESQSANISLYNEQFITLIEDVYSVTNRKSKCEDVAPIIELQSRIADLSQVDLIDFKRRRGLLNIFANSKNDKLLDHFYECGGRKGSENFIRNMILIEAKNACIINKDKGLISYEDALKVANEVAGNYKNIGIISLVKKQAKLTHDTVSTFVDSIINIHAKSLVGPNVDISFLKDSLPSLKSLKSIDPTQTIDYTSFILAVDTPLEIAEALLPEMIKSNMGPMLSGLVNESQKEDFFKKFNPKIEENYQQCIASTKHRVGFDNQSIESKMILRKNIANKFCKKNPSTCNANTCESKTNILTDDAKSSDMNIIQSCVLNAINQNLDMLFAQIISAQKESLESLITLSDKSTKSIAKQTKNLALTCANEKFKKSHNMIMPEVLKYVDATVYSETIGSCKNKIEENIVKQIAILGVAKMPAIEAFSKSTDTSFLHEKKVNKGSLNISSDLINTAINKCINAQKEKGIIDYSVTNCSPAIEMQVASFVINKTLSESLNDMPSDIQNKITLKLKLCTEYAKNDFLAAIGSNKHPNKVLTSKDANSFLKNNHKFLNCSKIAVNETADAIITKTINAQEEDLKNKLTDLSYFLELKEDLKTTASNCIMKNINNIPDWPSFMSFVDNKGISIAQKECEQETMELALTKLVNNEISNQIENLKGINLTDIDLENITDNIAKHYNLKLTKQSPKERNEEIIAKAFQAHQKKYPNEEIDIFINNLVSVATDSVISNLHNRLTDRVVLLGLPDYDFSDFKTKLTDGCLSDIYEHHKQNIEKLITDISNAQDKVEAQEDTDFLMLFVDFIQRGLTRAKEVNQYNDYLDSLNKLCANPTKHKTLKELIDTGIADHIILAQIEKQTASSFRDLIKSQCSEVFNGINELKGSGYENICDKATFTQEEINSIKSYFNNSNKFSAEQKNTIDFTLKRMFETQELITTYLESKYLKEVLSKDKELLSLIYNNITQIAGSYPPTINMLTKRLVSNLFADRSQNSFASNFVKSQLTAGVGISGYSIAKKALKDKLNSYKIQLATVEQKAMSSLHQKWKPDNIEEFLNWDTIDGSTRTELINSVYDHAVIPTVDTEYSEDRKQREYNQLVEHLSKHVMEYPSAENPDYRGKHKTLVFTKTGTPYWVEVSPSGDQFISIADRLTKDITSSTFSEVMRFWK